jgi:hypothetical protein
MKKIASLLIFSGIIFSKCFAVTYTVTSNSDSGPGTLRQAILDANALAGADDIVFSIGTGAQTITLTSIVDITSAININGSTQPGFSGTPLIKIYGTSMFQLNAANGATVQCLDFSGNSSSIAIRATSISNCSINNNNISGVAFAIRLDGDNDNNTINNNNLSGASLYGILFSTGVNNGNIITNNNITNCGARGLFYSLGTPASIDNNDFTGCSSAVYLGGANTFTLTSPTGLGPNKNTFGGHTGRVLDLFDNTNLNISNWDFTTLMLAPLNNKTPLFINNSTANIIDNCNLSGMQNGIQFNGDNTNDIISNCNFSGAVSKGIFFNSGINNGNSITNNNLMSCGNGLYYSSGTPSAINSNTFTASVDALYLESANTFTLGSGNVFKNQTGNSIQLESCTAVNISNISTNGTGGHGILINQSNNCIINSNNSCGRLYGIRIQGSSNSNKIINGNIVACSTGIQLDNSSVNTTTITSVNFFNTTNISNGGLNTIITGTTSTNTSPIISVNSGTICSGQSFTITPTGAITYTFSAGSSIVSPTTTTSYSVIGTDASGCVSALSAISSVPVFYTPAVSVNSGVICNGESFTMTPTTTPPGIVTYTYSGGSAVVSPTANATYSVFAVTNNGCMSSNSAISSVTVNSLPIISVNSGAICEGQSFTMTPVGADTYSYSNGGAITTPTSTSTFTITGTNTLTSCTNTVLSSVTVNTLPTISVNSGAICSGESFTMIPTGASTYTYSNGSSIATPTANATYSVSGTDSNGCNTNLHAKATVTVNLLPTISVSSGAVCAGESYTIIPNGALTYTTVPTLAGSVVTPTSTISYSFTGTDSNGCVSSNTAVSTVVVNSLPTILVNSGAICSGQSFTMTPTGASTYTYSNGSSVATPTADATYTVSGTGTNGCKNTATSTVTVNALPTLMTMTSNTLLCAGETATLSVMGASTYTWSTTENTMDIVVAPTVQTTYTVNATDVNGCSNTITITQDVSLCTGIFTMANNNTSIHLYPNPNNGLFSLELTKGSKVTVTNALGQIIIAEIFEAGKCNLDIQNESKGVYFVTVNENNRQQIIKLIKQ